MDGPWILVRLPLMPVLPAIASAYAAGFEIWTPTLLEVRRRPHGRGRVWTTRPAYPQYLVIAPGTDLAQLRRRFAWRIRPLRGEGAELTEAAVEALRELEAEWHETARRPRLPRARFAAGQLVTVRSCLFLGRRGRALADDGETVTLSVTDAPGRLLLPGICLAAC